MGASLSRMKSDYIIYVGTGFKKNAGTDANVTIILEDEDGQRSDRIKLNNFWKNDFEAGNLDVFYVKSIENIPHEGIIKNADTYVRTLLIDDGGGKTAKNKLRQCKKNDFEKGSLVVFYVKRTKKVRLGNIVRIEFWCDNSGSCSSWYVDRILVENRLVSTTFAFPVFRWIQPNRHYVINHLDTSLPQFDQYRGQRTLELEEKKKIYEYCQKSPGMPVQVKNVPEDEKFSYEYRWDFVKKKITLQAKCRLKRLTSENWNNLEDVISIYDNVSLPKPKNINGWKDDVYFGYQRIASHNNVLIRLCTEIPTKLAVTEEMLNPILEGNSLQDLLKAKRIFMIDLEILDGIKWKEGSKVCSPIALFMVDNNNQLRPIAIQLFQKPGLKNPVFLPTDNKNLWNLVKMWYNNADASFHQSLTHLGYTHLLMEGVCVCCHRNLSLSHPIFKLLAPHFHYLIAINDRALKLLIAEGGWIDKTMNTGSKGLINLVSKGTKRWSMSVNGNFIEDLKQRGVCKLDDPNVLPEYYYREDGLLLHEAIQKYCSKYVGLYYNTEEAISEDDELQTFAKELTLEIKQGGVGIKGVPNNGILKTKEDIISVVSSIIFTCSVSHAAANFPQYEHYSFPPNFPATMRGTPPTTKDPVQDDFILKTLADKEITQDTMIVTKILSSKGTDSLGYFEVQYVFDPKALKLIMELRKDLREISKTIKKRNKTRKFKYDYLDPESIPNSIGI